MDQDVLKMTASIVASVVLLAWGTHSLLHDDVVLHRHLAGQSRFRLVSKLNPFSRPGRATEARFIVKSGGVVAIVLGTLILILTGLNLLG